MAGVRQRFTIDDVATRRFLDEAIRRGQDMSPAMDVIGNFLVTSTEERFERGEAPDGSAWPPSIRVQSQGGQTLVETGRMMQSLSHVFGRDFVEWGTNVLYAAIHQFGGTIKAVAGPFLTFRVGGRWVRKRQVTIPARPFLGISTGDEAEVANILGDFIRGAQGAGAGAK